MFFQKRKNIVKIKGQENSEVFYAKKIYNDRKEFWIKKDADEYAKIDLKYFKKNQRVFHKAKHFVSWAIKLLVPDFLIGHPNLWDNLQSLRKNPQFKPLRMALAAWLIFAMVAGSTGIYALLNSQKAKAAGASQITKDTDTDFNQGTLSSTQITGSGSSAYVNLAPYSHWFDTNYIYRRQLTVDITGNSSLGAGYAVYVTLSGTDANNIYSHSLSNGNDFRIVYFDGATNTELDRSIISFSSSSINFYFKTQAALSANDTTHYYIYYGYGSAVNPPANTANIFSATNIATTGTASATDNYGSNYSSCVNDTYADGTHCGWGNNAQANSRVMIKLSSARKIWKVVQYWGGDDVGGWTKPTGTYFPTQYRTQYSTLSGAVAGDAYDSANWTSLVDTTDSLTVSRIDSADYANPTYAGSPTLSGSISTTNSSACTSCWGTKFVNSFNPVSALSVRLAFINPGYIGTMGEFFIYPVNTTDATAEPTVSAGSEVSQLPASGTWESPASSNVIDLVYNVGWGDGSSGSSTAFSATVANVSASSTIDFFIRVAATTGALASASYIDLGTVNSGTSFSLTKSQFDSLGVGIGVNRYIQVKATFAETNQSNQSSGRLDNFTLYYMGDNYPATPSSVLPSNGAINQDPTLTLSSSAFSDPDPGDSQSAAQWQIRSLSDATYSSPVYNSGVDATDLTSISVPSGNLSKNTTYFWRVRYEDSHSAWSSYSPETAFTVGVTPITVVSVGATEYQSGETAKLTVQVQDATGAPLNSATTAITIYSPATPPVALITAASMTYITSSNGLYYYNYTVPATEGVYTYQVTATYSGNTSYSSHAFHVSPALNTIATLNTTLNTVNTNLNTANTNINSANSTLGTVNTNVNSANTTLNTINTNVNTVNSSLSAIGSTLQAANAQTKAGILNTQTTLKAGNTINIEYAAHTGLTYPDAPEIYVYNPANNACISGANMTEMGTSGIYQYNLTIPATGISGCYGTGYYTILVSESAYGTHGNMQLYVGNNDLQSIGTNTDNLVGAFIVTQSSVNDTSPTATSFVSALTNITNDFYKNSVLTFNSGGLNGQVRRISAYNGTTKAVTLDPALTSAPSNGDIFTIVKQNVRVEEQATAIQSDVTSVKSDVGTIKSDVSYIKGKVDSIYALLGTVDTNLSSTQTAVNSIRTSQQKAYKARLSDVSQIQTGNTYYAKLTLLDYQDNPVDAATTPIITIYDPAGVKKADAQQMTKDSTGNYSYSYSILSTDTAGLWEALVTTAVGSSSAQILNDYFDVTGSPAQVSINSVSTTIPTISANAKITNEGSGDFEYHYEWCVVADQANQCGGNDDVDYGSDSKLIKQGESYVPTLTATVPTAGTYWFKFIVYYGTQASGASRQFTATTSTTPPVVSGGGGGNGYQTLTIDALGSQIQDMQKTITEQSSQITKVLDALGIKTEVLSGSGQPNSIQDIQNKLADLQAISSSIEQIVQNNSASPVVQTYMKFDSVVMSFLITNPASTKQTVNFKAALPVEVTLTDIINLGGLNIDYDTAANSYYVYGNISLGAKQSIEKSVEIKDIWLYDTKNLDSIKSQVASFEGTLKNTQYSAQGVLLENDIDNLINTIETSQKQSYTSPQDHILAYRNNKSNLDEVNNDFNQLKNLLVQSGASQGLLGKIGGIQTFATWGIILAIVFGFGLMGFIIFSMWRYQVVLAAQVINSNNRVLSRFRRKVKRN